MRYSVSIIVPMYNVQQFVEKCARHLLEQTMENIEIIFIDDCSPDESSAIVSRVLERYPSRKPHVKIIRHKMNKGLPSARNTGLVVASGEYVFHCDGDDWLETEAIERLYNAAKTNNADIVWCDWYLSFQNNERYMSQDPGSASLTSVASVELLLAGKIRYNVWNKLVKTSLYKDHNLHFPDGHGMGEDMAMIKVFAYAQKVVYLPQALYHYVQLNNDAFTKKMTAQHLEDIKYNVDTTIHFIRGIYGDNMDMFVQFFKLNVKLPFLISTDVESYERWLAWYPEANAFIDANPMFSNRAKFIQKTALRRQFWILKLYYYLIIRVVYGLIYK
ncbi:glycosyltransferase family 2 protein [Sphingobacterium chuzhouense]|uniref:Glycosyltransferase family 2 protein n=1 Tax=Sphingobacterium chuzhouense TaxID=1742264 RepID=A0ABR7XTY9_9SPHI|nr:glycosyltransferase family 2 protein [Sphingobacterium chuzhouense]MBD1422497.1 glycosyltransferase family 2 protein [Sphingobacterium chuzhouense]